MNKELQKYIMRTAVKRTLDVTYVLNSLEEYKSYDLYTKKIFLEIRERILLFNSNDKTAEERSALYKKVIEAKRIESTERCLQDLQCHLELNKRSDMNEIILPHIKRITEIESMIQRRYEVNLLMKKLRECIADFKKGDMVLSVTEERLNLRP